MKSNKTHNVKKLPSTIGAMTLIGIICISLFLQMFVLKIGSVTQITLFLLSVTTGLFALYNGYSLKEIDDSIIESAKVGLYPMFILLMVGMLISTWIAAGTIPALIYFGLKVISPSFFLFSVCLVCAVGSIATGSSWTTGATFGIAFIGIGSVIGIPAPMTAGAIISGAYFGDKMSPLSDTTNLAAAVAGVDLFKHIRSMLYTSVPVLAISLIAYLLMGIKYSTDVSPDQLSSINAILIGLKSGFNINVLCLLPPVIVIYMAVKKYSGLSIMAIAILLGMFLAIVTQGFNIGEILISMQSGFVSDTGITEIDKLLTRGGMNGMMWTVSFSFLALTLGGLLESTRVLEVLLNKLDAMTKSQGNMILIHTLSSLVVSATTASQYMSVVLAGRMYLPAYRKLKIKPEVCSRVCEDSGTIASVLIPWSSGAVYFTGILGVATVDYLPFALFAYLSPVITVLYAYANKFIFKYSDEEYEVLLKEDRVV